MLPQRKEVREGKQRQTEKYEGRKANTKTLQSSSIPYLQEVIKRQDIEERVWRHMPLEE